VPFFNRAASAAILALALAGGAAAKPMPHMAGMAAAPAKTATITIGNFTFGPMSVTVPVGGTVTWVNADDVPHTVVSENQAFRSKPIDTDGRYTFTFAKPGVYSYFCSLHPRMVGKIIVR
jgi:plastocyanin